MLNSLFLFSIEKYCCYCRLKQSKFCRASFRSYPLAQLSAVWTWTQHNPILLITRCQTDRAPIVLQRRLPNQEQDEVTYIFRCSIHTPAFTIMEMYVRLNITSLQSLIYCMLSNACLRVCISRCAQYLGSLSDYKVSFNHPDCNTATCSRWDCT